ncbi:hypothetical protein TNCT_504221 [Trichonephila clavata]|uniref:Uncharacterized protein n=1 Tax=Trichonephila clavata TaxID=2740835 RepID=A0A8X6FW95_TRICU|nr:hypothetical protein TNCT_504221 [Trichonephila clavata]
MRDYSGRCHGNRFGGGRIDETKACFTAAGAYLVAMVTSIWRAPPMSGSSPQKGTTLPRPPSNKINPFFIKKLRFNFRYLHAHWRGRDCDVNRRF